MSDILIAGNLYAHVHVIVDDQIGTHSFQKVSIKDNMNALGSTFSLVFPNRWVLTQNRFRLLANKRVRVILRDRNIMVVGRVEQIGTQVDSDKHSISVSGRDNTGDLIDCSPNNFEEFNNLTLKQIAEKVCAPFDIGVIDYAKDTHIFVKAKFRPGEKVFAFLDRVSKQRGLLLNSVVSGTAARPRMNVSIAKVGQFSHVKERLDYRNILSCQTKVDVTKVFSEYNVISQTSEVENIEDDFGEVTQETSAIGTVKDDSIDRYRPLTIIANKQATNEEALSRAQWEHVRRLGEMLQFKILVNGWRTRDNDIWRPNRKIRVNYPHAGLDGIYLITGCEYIYGAGESIKTALTLTHKDAFTPSPTVSVKADPNGNCLLYTSPSPRDS